MGRIPKTREALEDAMIPASTILNAWMKLYPDRATLPDADTALREIVAEAIAARATLRTIRTPDEMQQAHDLIVGLLLDHQLRNAAPSDILVTIKCAADVLCWCLRHDHNAAFASLLKSITERLAAYGVELVEEPPAIH